MKVSTKVQVQLSLSVEEQAQLKVFLRNLNSSDIRPITTGQEDRIENYQYVSPYTISDLLNKIGQEL